MIRGRWLAVAVAATALFVIPGCGGGGHQVSGTVRVRGGEPLQQGTVQFISDRHTLSGAIGPGGRYTLAGDGVPPGTYRVAFLSTEIGGGYDHAGEPVQQVIHPRYANPTTTPIEATVPSESYDFELDPPE